ncbi:MAG: acetyltransferase [Opitutaceae bacterium]|nr:acetyltransferase [Opitutaceae bacterium]
MGKLPGLIIIGAGGFGREVLAWAEQSEQMGRDWTIKGFIDDNLEALTHKRSPGKLIGRLTDHQPADDEVFVCAVGVPAVKQRCSELIATRGGRFTRIIHRTAVLGHEVELAEGVILCPHSVVSANNRIGRGVAVNLHATVDHDTEVGDWTQINCHSDLTGGVRIGRSVWISSHVVIAPGVSVGDGAYLGAGAVVMRDVDPGTKVFGVPARRIE